MRDHRFSILMAGVALVGLLASACGQPPKVEQGTVVRYESASHTLVLKSERQPEQEITFSLDGAEIGAEPVEKDLVRIAYREDGGRLLAVRVMNLTRQKELAK